MVSLSDVVQAVFVVDLRYRLWLDALALSAFAVPTLVRRLARSYASAVPYVVSVSAALGVVSIATGLFNGGTDEPFAIPRYVTVLAAGHNPYVVPLVFDYRVVQFLPGTVVPLHSTTTFVYLPLSMFLQIPFTGAVGYESLTLFAWAATVYLLRHDRWSVLVFGSPVIALLAANGFNDLLPIALLTYALSPRAPPRRRTAAEIVAYGTKQFAPIVMGIYYLARRRWLALAGVALVTVAFVVPFLIWGPWPLVACVAFLIPMASCPASEPLPAALYLHWNYYLWPVWLGALFGPRLYRWARSPEGLPYLLRARQTVRRVVAERHRRSFDLLALVWAYASAWGHGFRPGSAGPVPSESLGPATGNPFSDWPPPS